MSAELPKRHPGINPRENRTIIDPTKGQTFTLERILGKGATADVFAATDDAGNQHALKLFYPPPKDPNQYQPNPAKEAAIHRELRHDNIITYYTSGKTNEGLHYLVTELATKGSLDALIKTGGMPITEVLPFLLDITRALLYLHGSRFGERRPMAHADIKLSNILIGDSKAKLGDFGLTQLVINKERVAEQFGSYRYVAPEQLRGSGPTTASDMYAFAITTFRALTGEYPYGDLDKEEQLRAHMEQEPRNLPDVLGGSPQNIALGEVLTAAMAKDPSTRPAAKQFGKALRRAAKIDAESRPIIIKMSGKKPVTQAQLEQETGTFPSVSGEESRKESVPVVIDTERTDNLTQIGSDLETMRLELAQTRQDLEKTSRIFSGEESVTQPILRPAVHEGPTGPIDNRPPDNRPDGRPDGHTKPHHKKYSVRRRVTAAVASIAIGLGLMSGGVIDFLKKPAGNSVVKGGEKDLLSTIKQAFGPNKPDASIPSPKPSPDASPSAKKSAHKPSHPSSSPDTKPSTSAVAPLPSVSQMPQPTETPSPTDTSSPVATPDAPTASASPSPSESPTA